MQPNPIKINIYSDYSDLSDIINSLSKFENDKIKLNLPSNGRILTGEDVITIIYPKDRKSIFINGFKNIQDSKNNVIFVINSNEAILASHLARLQIRSFFVLPYEENLFVQSIENKLKEINSNEKTTVTEKVNKTGFENIIGNSAKIIETISMAKTIAINPDINTLILGETGTGKGLMAKSIHNFSSKQYTPYIEVTCTAIPETLLESELFGYEKGAFTDARNKKPGLFELAEGGTIFLDEIGDLSMGLQAKLLRVIEKKQMRRLGGVTDIPINARIISATNKNLVKLVEEGKFRIDLYYRLNVISIELPPLREREDDVVTLSKYFIDNFSERYQKRVKEIDSNLFTYFKKYEWPGNIRELRNVIERAILLMKDDRLKLDHFKDIIYQNPNENKKEQISEEEKVNLDLNFKITDLRKLSEIYANQVLQKLNGNKSKTAKALGVSRPKLDNLLN